LAPTFAATFRRRFVRRLAFAFPLAFARERAIAMLESLHP
jgi:hypothetical protein